MHLQPLRVVMHPHLHGLWNERSLPTQGTRQQQKKEGRQTHGLMLRLRVQSGPGRIVGACIRQPSEGRVMTTCRLCVKGAASI